MFERHQRHARALSLARALTFGLCAAACAAPYPAPTAVIAAFDASGTPTACKPLTGPLDARIGTALPVTAACSEDKNKNALTYFWSLVDAPAGSVAALHNEDAITPTFVPDVQGPFRLKLVVSNGVVTSDPAFAEIAVGVCGGRAPVVDAITPSVAAPATGQMVTLAAGVSDADTGASCQAHGATFSYDWFFTDLPPGSFATLNDARVAAPSFVPDVAGRYGFAVSVTDPTGRHTMSTGSLTASGPTVRPADCGHSPPVASAELVMPGSPTLCGDTPLIADLAGKNQLMLDAERSSDPDNSACGVSQSLSYEWTLLTTPLNGGFSHLESKDGRSTILRVWSDGAYQVRLVATDSTGLESPPTVCSLYVSGYK
jgi:hypothetical protein